MTEDSSDGPDSNSSARGTDETLGAAAISDPYKVLGDFADPSDGIGILGRNTATSGATSGVEGRVNSPDGHGLSTPDDARIEGVLDTASTDFVVDTGTTGNDANNVVVGHPDNAVRDGAAGATIGGGGFTDSPNEVFDTFGTVGGGRGNAAGSDDDNDTTAYAPTVGGGNGNTASGRESSVGGGAGNTASASGATVAGGGANTASGQDATVGGGDTNEATAGHATVAGGELNDTTGSHAAVAGGELNEANASHAAVAGGELNDATGSHATVAGGELNQAAASHAAIGGGGATDGTDATANAVHDDYGTVGGGSNNLAGSDDDTANAGYATVGGGHDNEATGESATVGGGELNRATATHATVAGGGSTDGTDSTGNVVYEDYGTVGGGGNNQAGSSNSTSGVYATVSGGRTNGALDKYATVAGGQSNTANYPYTTVGGGYDSNASAYGATVGGGFSNQAAGEYATVPGGRSNDATGDYSFAAGRSARAQDTGTFVWSDSGSTLFSSTAADQFLVEAGGGVGIGTDSPVTTFHVKDSVAESGGDNLGRHVAAIENTSSSSDPSPDVLGLELTNVTDPGQFNSYISFMDSSGTIGNIQGDGNGGMEFVGSLADFAEFFPQADPDREFAGGEVVGLRDGEVVADTDDADAALVVSTAPFLTGNRPVDEDERGEYVKLSLVGQVPVRVTGPVESGDVLVASPDDDGTAVARRPGETGRAPVIGQALESHSGRSEGEDDGGTEGEVLALVGGPGRDTAVGRESAERGSVEALRRELDERADRIDALEAETENLREENVRLHECVAGLEKRLTAVEGGVGVDPASADD